MFPAPSARQAFGLSRIGNGHFDLGIKGFLSEGNRFRPKKSKKEAGALRVKVDMDSPVVETGR